MELTLQSGAVAGVVSLSPGGACVWTRVVGPGPRHPGLPGAVTWWGGGRAGERGVWTEVSCCSRGRLAEVSAASPGSAAPCT